MKGTNSLPSLVSVGCASFGFSLAFPFVFRMMVPAISFCWISAPIPLDYHCASSVEVCVTFANEDLGSNFGVHHLHNGSCCGVAHWRFCVLLPSHEGMLHHGSTCH